MAEYLILLGKLRRTEIGSLPAPDKRSRKGIAEASAEELRHAHFLKQQVHRLEAPYPHDYFLPSLLGGMDAYHYLDRLDAGISRLLNKKGHGKELNYLLVTYAIERRAEEVYALYHVVLKQARSPIQLFIRSC